MFPLPPNNDPQNHDHTLILDDLLLHQDLIDQQHEDYMINFATTSTEGPSRSGPVRVPAVNKQKRNDLRKYVHREIERQRRQEMANLCGSLRTLVPIHSCTKGKHSKCDVMEEAVDHIKDMQNNIEKLKAKRDALRRKSGIKNSMITVNPSHDGVEILINTSFQDQEQGYFCLSTILRELVHSGFYVLSCVSTRTDAKLLHRIQAGNPAFNDLSGLQERLAYLIQQ